MDAFKLKIIGYVTLVISYVGNIFYPGSILLNIVGSMNITIFVFLAVEGYRNTHNLTKYILRLFIFTFISAIPYYMIYTKPFNSVLSILFCVGTLAFIDRIKNDMLKFVTAASFVILSTLLQLEWAPFPVILAILFFIYREKFYMLSFYTIALFTILFFVTLFFGQIQEIKGIYMIGCILPLPIIQLYNGKKGHNIKWISYAIYPAMLFIITAFKLS